MNLAEPIATGTTFSVLPDRAYAIKGYPGLECHCLAGELWVTQEGDVRDYIVQPGNKMVASSGGRIIVATLRAGPARASVTAPRTHSDDIAALEFESNSLQRFLQRVQVQRNAAIREYMRVMWRWLCGPLKGLRRR